MFQLVEKGIKRFEVRNNDRDYKVFDMVTLLESVNGTLTGRRYGPVEIDYVLTKCPWLPEGSCVFNWKENKPISTSAYAD